VAAAAALLEELLAVDLVPGRGVRVPDRVAAGCEPERADEREDEEHDDLQGAPTQRG
jgi:hypothetical protein